MNNSLLDTPRMHPYVPAVCSFYNINWFSAPILQNLILFWGFRDYFTILFNPKVNTEKSTFISPNFKLKIRILDGT